MSVIGYLYHDFSRSLTEGHLDIQLSKIKISQATHMAARHRPTWKCVLCNVVKQSAKVPGLLGLLLKKKFKTVWFPFS